LKPIPEAKMDVLCIACGKTIQTGKMIQRRLNGKIHFLCCIACEVKWEKQNMVGTCG
jgi:hypothetical protein